MDNDILSFILVYFEKESIKGFQWKLMILRFFWNWKNKLFYDVKNYLWSTVLSFIIYQVETSVLGLPPLNTIIYNVFTKCTTLLMVYF